MIAYARDEVSFVSRRSLFFFFIVGLHVAIIYAFATGLAHPLIKRIQDMDVISVPDVTPRQPPPPPLPEPTLSNNITHLRTEVLLPPPDITVDTEVASSAAPVVIGDSTPSQPPPAKIVQRVGGGPGKGFPNVDDFYPPSMIRLGKEGATLIRTCVDATGRLTGMPVVSQSSGTGALDDAALKAARAGSGHYRPTTEDGQAVSSCYEFRIIFHLKK